MKLIASLLLVSLILLVTSCSMFHTTKPSTATTKPTTVQLDMTRVDIAMVNLLAALKPAEVEYTSKVMTADVEKLYVQANNSYTRLRGTWNDYHQAVGLGVKLDVVKVRWAKDLESCQATMYQLQRGRGVRP